MNALAALNDDGVRLGLLATAFAFGLRHGIDWDHIAAIADLTTAHERPRRAVLFASLYVAGHAVVVLVLGVLAISFAEHIPDWLDAVMERLVGVTLLALGFYVVYSLVRHGRDFRMRSRWMLMGEGAGRAIRWLRRRSPSRQPTFVIEHDHEHNVATHHESEQVVVAAAAPGGSPIESTHRHWHRHEAVMPEDPVPEPRRLTAFGVGMIHGVGAETPTQVLVFLAAAGAGGRGAGLLVLVCFVAGLVAANTAIAVVAAAGFLRASGNGVLHVALSIIIATLSLGVGALSLAGRGDLLPTLLAG